ncbi:MAG: SDR family NAD(P)-dependent oxidoreductase [Thermoleophilaceae bacterium]
MSVTRRIRRTARIASQQVPDELLRIARSASGRASLEGAVDGRVVLVTGASSGIGRAAALQLGRAGAVVVLVARRREALEEVRDEIEASGGSAHVHPADLAEPDDVERMAAEVLAAHGHVDVLVNNAGRSIRRSLALSHDRFHDFERTIQLNYLGAVRLILALLPSMRERRRGHVVNVSTMGVQTNTPRFSAYIASKAALDAFSRCAAAELLDDRITITTIHMPLVRTPMIEPTTMYRSFPSISPERAAGMVCDAIVHRPKRIATPLGHLGELAYTVHPKSVDAVMGTGFRLFPDSAAAKGRQPRPAEAERPTRAALAFARLLRGIHW